MTPYSSAFCKQILLSHCSLMLCSITKRDTYALYLASKDPRVPWYAKLLLGFVVDYALSPIDLIPDFIVIGLLLTIPKFYPEALLTVSKEKGAHVAPPSLTWFEFRKALPANICISLRLYTPCSNNSSIHILCKAGSLLHHNNYNNRPYFLLLRLDSYFQSVSRPRTV